MILKTRGIVLNVVKYSDSSLIVKVFTLDAGLKSFMVKGARTVGVKNKTAFFQPVNILDLEFFRRENKNLLFLKELCLYHIFTGLTTDIMKKCIALFMVEVL